MLDMGIVPAMTGDELVKMLESLSPENRRIAKRKFRKAWRKMLKKNPELRELLTETEDDSNRPSKSAIRNRSVYVVADIVRNID